MNIIPYIALGQNRIDYIVYHNTLEAKKLLYDKGFEPPQDPEDVAEAIKELVRNNGETAITSLLQIHPDKNAILSTFGSRTICSSCKSAITDKDKGGCNSCKASKEDAFVDDVTDDRSRLQMLYKKYNENPNDLSLEKEIESLWNTLRSSKNASVKQEETPQPTMLLTKKELLIYSGIFTAGVLLGMGLSFSKT